MVICYPLGSGYGMKPVPVTVIGDGDGKKFVSWGWLWYSNNRWLVSPLPHLGVHRSNRPSEIMDISYEERSPSERDIAGRHKGSEPMSRARSLEQPAVQYFSRAAHGDWAESFEKTGPRPRLGSEKWHADFPSCCNCFFIRVHTLFL